MKALIVVDWQREWIDPESEYYVGSNLQEYTPKINSVIEFARNNNFRIIFIRHFEKDGVAFKEDSDNVKFIDGLDVEFDSDISIQKFKISPFYQTNLEEELNGVVEIFVCGILTNLCVRSTVCDAYDRDFKVNIIEDCCAAFTPEIHNFTVEDIKTTRPEISTITVADLLL